jgi:hypothetical protein
MGGDNGGRSEIPSTGNPLVDAAMKRLWERNDARFRDLEDAMVVQAHLEKSMAEMLKQHSITIVRHDEFLERHDLLMREFDEKLNALIDIVMRRESGPAS